MSEKIVETIKIADPSLVNDTIEILNVLKEEWNTRYPDDQDEIIDDLISRFKNIKNIIENPIS